MGGDYEQTVQKPSGGKRKHTRRVQGAGTAPEAASGSPASPEVVPGSPAPPLAGSGLNDARSLLATLSAWARASANQPGLQPLRLHQANGQIHFHDDDASPRLKVGLPMADVWQARERVLHLQTFVWHDNDHDTLLTMQPTLTPAGVLDVELRVTPCAITHGPTLAALLAVLDGKVSSDDQGD